MASSNSPPIFMTLLFSSFILLSSVHEAVAAWSSKTIKELCNINAEDWNKTSCIKALNSDHRIVSATNLVSLAIGIIESGISNATNTRAYLKKEIIQEGVVEPVYKKTYNECVEYYDGAINSLDSALHEVKDDKDYETSSYDVLIAADNVNNCEKALVSRKVDAPLVSAGNKVVRYFGVAADKVVTRLWLKSPPKPRN